MGSFPSVKSRQSNFFYGHPQNRFWRVLSSILGEQTPITVDDKKAFLLKNNIAVWDVIKSCDIVGSSDSSIQNVVANDISPIINQSKIQAVYVNGKAAYNLYLKYIYPINNIQPNVLLSTSPANARCKIDMLIDDWSKLLTHIKSLN